MFGSVVIFIDFFNERRKLNKFLLDFFSKNIDIYIVVYELGCFKSWIEYFILGGKDDWFIVL